MDDAELIKRVQDGDKEAYAPLVRRHHADILRFCYSMLSNWAEADDAAQETFVKAYRALKNFRGDSALLTWLHRIASNQCLDMLRKRTRQKTDSWDALMEEKGERLEALLNSAPDEINRLENTELVQRVLGLLSDDQRHILLLREMQNLSYDEIAATLDCSLDAVKARLLRARRSFLEKVQHILNPTNV